MIAKSERRRLNVRAAANELTDIWDEYLSSHVGTRRARVLARQILIMRDEGIVELATASQINNVEEDD